MSPLLEIVALGQSVVTALSSGFNTAYFWAYRSPQRGRRLAALVLAVVNLALLLESLYVVGWALLAGEDWWRSFFLDPRWWLAARLLAALGALLISGLILRQIVRRARG